MIEIIDEWMSLKIDNKVMAAAWFSQHATGDSNGA